MDSRDRESSAESNISIEHLSHQKSATDQKYASRGVAFVVRHSQKGIVSLCTAIANLLKNVDEQQMEIESLKQSLMQFESGTILPVREKTSSDNSENEISQICKRDAVKICNSQHFSRSCGEKKKLCPDQILSSSYSYPQIDVSGSSIQSRISNDSELQCHFSTSLRDLSTLSLSQLAHDDSFSSSQQFNVSNAESCGRSSIQTIDPSNSQDCNYSASEEHNVLQIEDVLSSSKQSDPFTRQQYSRRLPERLLNDTQMNHCDDQHKENSNGELICNNQTSNLPNTQQNQEEDYSDSQRLCISQKLESSNSEQDFADLSGQQDAISISQRFDIVESHQLNPVNSQECQLSDVQQCDIYAGQQLDYSSSQPKIFDCQGSSIGQISSLSNSKLVSIPNDETISEVFHYCNEQDLSVSSSQRMRLSEEDLPKSSKFSLKKSSGEIPYKSNKKKRDTNVHVPKRVIKGCICNSCCKSEDHLTITAPLQFGDRVVIKGEISGTVQYVGHICTGDNSEIYVGLVLDAPIGDCDGSFNDKIYFKCSKRYGYFVSLFDVLCLLP